MNMNLYMMEFFSIMINKIQFLANMQYTYVTLIFGVTTIECTWLEKTQLVIHGICQKISLMMRWATSLKIASCTLSKRSNGLWIGRLVSDKYITFLDYFSHTWLTTFTVQLGESISEQYQHKCMRRSTQVSGKSSLSAPFVYLVIKKTVSLLTSTF